jgi:tetratricopeptide (TPR) repeat protein
VALERAGRLDEAAEAYRALAGERPSTVVWMNLGNVETARDRLEAAEDAYTRALELTPDEPEALAAMAWLRFRQGRNAEAEALAGRAAQAPGAVAGLALDTVARARLPSAMPGAADRSGVLDALPRGTRRGRRWRRAAAAAACAASRPGG